MISWCTTSGDMNEIQHIVSACYERGFKQWGHEDSHGIGQAL